MYGSSQNNRNEDRKEDKPPYSRVFVVCSKQTQEDDLRTPFEKYGTVEDFYMPRDRNTGDPKGVAYIKFSKTSSAAAAIHDLQAKPLKINNKPIKVMVASSKHDSNSTNEERYRRLFIKVHKDITESEVYDHFSNFGHVDSVYLQRDKSTDKCKGFAYVHYTCFLDAAKAFEECDRKYKPVFATPKDELKRARTSLEGGVFGAQLDNTYSSNSHFNKDNFYTEHKRESFNLHPNASSQHCTSVIVTCSPQVPQKCIEKLFNIIPGMIQCQYTLDTYNGYCKALISYDNEQAATCALQKINNFEFPSGEIVFVKPDDNPINKAANTLSTIVNSFKNSLDSGNPNLLQLADAIAEASTLIKAATTVKIENSSRLLENKESHCSVPLPSPQPMANANSRVAQRCFIVCKPYPPPGSALRDAFCRFGDLIDVCTFPNKTFGFVKYASERAAQEAIKTLNGAVLCGIQLKVLEADEKPSKDDDDDDVKMIIHPPENYLERDKDCKRMKFSESRNYN
ncbi:unnamed protein product [Chilo suppressalis]|uniref:RRM domain-containing protein n=1 Tax=Chilo suppressalis TaxID=168631 RepID=A0ABN8BBT4_CHISP|nr:unnamed protein product [Chilo suppressalis]